MADLLCRDMVRQIASHVDAVDQVMMAVVCREWCETLPRSMCLRHDLLLAIVDDEDRDHPSPRQFVWWVLSERSFPARWNTDAWLWFFYAAGKQRDWESLSAFCDTARRHDWYLDTDMVDVIEGLVGSHDGGQCAQFLGEVKRIFAIMAPHCQLDDDALARGDVLFVYLNGYTCTLRSLVMTSNVPLWHNLRWIDIDD